jgi:hypothetical protein
MLLNGLRKFASFTAIVDSMSRLKKENRKRRDYKNNKK